MALKQMGYQWKDIGKMALAEVVKESMLYVYRDLPPYYQYKDQDRDYICSQADANGMHTCSNIPPMKMNGIVCNGTADTWVPDLANNTTCINWNQYYTDCKSQGQNPFQGTISFDNIGLAWVAIFVVR